MAEKSIELKSERTQVDVFDIADQSYWGRLSLEQVNEQYHRWRNQGIGVMLDRDGHICIDREDAEDDGLLYAKQLAEIIDNFGNEAEVLKSKK